MGRTNALLEKNEKHSAGMIFLFYPLQCVFFITKKYILELLEFTDKKWLPQVSVCPQRVNTGCECDASGAHSLPECYSIHAAKSVRSQAAGGTAVSEGPSEDRPLKWGQTADWHAATPDTRPPSRTAKTHPSSSCHLVAYSEWGRILLKKERAESCRSG